MQVPTSSSTIIVHDDCKKINEKVEQQFVITSSTDEEDPNPPCIAPDDEMTNKRERSNSRDFVSSKGFGMIARIAMGGMLLINTVMNSHSLHDSIVRYEATIDNNFRLPTEGNTNDDDNVRRNGKRKLVDRKPVASSSSNTDDEESSLDQALLSFLSESSVGRQKVIEFMIDQYVSPSTPDNNMVDKLDNAMEAMSFLETDAEPVQVLGYPFLFVGSVGESTHILLFTSIA
jgi:hypothetical protein